MDKRNLKTRIFIGVILVGIGLSFLINDFLVERRERVFSSMNLELTELMLADTNQEQNEVSTPTVTAQEEITPEPQPSDYETYIGILEIPKIGFSKGFYKKESSLNNVKFNLKILPQSNYPDEDKGNVIIIGHSGNYSNSYFGNLYQLETGDTASISYNNKKYIYKIVNIYTDIKDGTVTIYRDETKSCLTLITCTKDDETTQTIYILERISVE
ncbi:MAG: sortase [Erysipelotrichaceae bacterium]|nr:sortase [Erysipelotrichaceae bacterium]